MDSGRLPGSGRSPGSGRLPWRASTIMLVAAGIALVLGLVAATQWLVSSGGRVADATDAAQSMAPSLSVGTDGLVPTRISLPTLDVEGSVEAAPTTSAYSHVLGTDATTFGMPTDKAAVAWWRDGARPGSEGLSVIVGSPSDGGAPGVFDAISEMARGDKIVLRSAGSQIVTYLVSEVLPGVRANDPESLRSALNDTRTHRAVALVTFGAQRLSGSGDVIVVGRLRSN